MKYSQILCFFQWLSALVLMQGQLLSSQAGHELAPLSCLLCHSSIVCMGLSQSGVTALMNDVMGLLIIVGLLL